MGKIRFLFLSLILVFSSCAGIQTYVDYDEEIAYDQYKTFDYFTELETGLEDLDEARVLRILDEEIEKKGFSKSDQPDFYINLYSESFKKRNQHNIGLSIGTYGRNVGGQIGSGIPINSTQNMLSLIIEIVDAEQNILVWQGIVDAKVAENYTPEKKKAYFQKQIKKLLKEFPPKK